MKKLILGMAVALATLVNADVHQTSSAKKEEWDKDRFIWPVGSGGAIPAPTHSSFMYPSWTGIAGHTYQYHTGMDVGYFAVTTEDGYKEYRDKLPSVLAAASGEVIFVKSDEGDACGIWLLTEQQIKDKADDPTAAKFPKSDACGGGCNQDDLTTDAKEFGNCAGNYVVIDHDPGDKKGLLEEVGYRYSAYYHLQKGETSGVVEGALVNSGDEIGKMGSSGQSLTPHLHFEVHKDRIDVGSPSTYSGTSKFSDSMVDPFYSLHDGRNNRRSGGSSMWRDQCSEERAAKYGQVMAHALSAVEYELDSGSINPRYLVTGKENHNEIGLSKESGLAGISSGRAGIASGVVDYNESESWQACGRDITPPCPVGQLLVDGECK